MNDPHFTGYLESVEIVPKLVKKEDGTEETFQNVCIELKTEEQYPRRVLITLTGELAQQFLQLPPSQYKMLVTAYLSFRIYKYERNDVKKRWQQVSAWKLEVTTSEGKVYVLPHCIAPTETPSS